MAEHCSSFLPISATFYISSATTAEKFTKIATKFQSSYMTTVRNTVLNVNLNLSINKECKGNWAVQKYTKLTDRLKVLLLQLQYLDYDLKKL